VSTVSDSGALISRTQLMNVLRNPWRTPKTDAATLDSTIEDLAIEAPVRPFQDAVSGLARIPVSRYAMSGLALVKVSIPLLRSLRPIADTRDVHQLCSLLPPFRETLPPPGILYALLLLCIVDLQARNVAVSSTLNACHALGLLWIGKG
jgi:hypothetical protein